MRLFVRILIRNGMGEVPKRCDEPKEFAFRILSEDCVY